MLTKPPIPGERMLAGTDLRLPRLAFGLWRFVGRDVSGADRLLRTALDAGLTLIDGAAVYGLDWGGASFGESEQLLGQVLKADPGLRARMILATKFGITLGIPYDSSRASVIKSCEDSLRRLQTDVIDLFQVHRPDVLTHPADLAETLSTLRKAGKIRAAGVSNYSARQTLNLQQFLDFDLATHQPEFSALCLSPVHDGVLDQCLSRAMVPLAWSPLGGGRLALTLHEAHEADPSGRLAKVISALDHTAHEMNTTRVSVALSFVMAHPAHPIPIIGTQNSARIIEACRAVSIQLSRAQWYKIASAGGMDLP